jgi:23S rRNA (pseudouridine1915-N3)-methyltransferase
MIRVFAVGRLRLGWAQEACADYDRRLRRFGGVETIEIPDSDPAGEAKQLRQKLKGGPIVACDPHGDSWSSETLAEFLGHHGSPGFLIGGPEGIDADLLEQADHRLGFGAITLPHELARVVLFEQIYRGLSILRGHPYHR